MDGALAGCSATAPIKSIKHATWKETFMHQQKSKNTKKNHWDRLDELIGNEPEPTGEEWFTTKELRERMGISEATAHRRLAEMNQKGMLEVWKGGSSTSNHFTVKYRLKD